jgi:serine phosphatase RsbU (regulator of sigma subunit)
MSGKYTQMVEYKNFLLIAGNNGLFAVKDKKAEPVLKNTYIVDIYKTSLGDELYCSTNNGLYRIYLANDKWEIDHFAQTTSSLINSVTQEKNGNWIIAYEDILIRAKLKYNKIEIIHEIKLPEMPGQTFIVKNINDSVLAFTSSKIYHFESSGELNEIKEMSLDSYVIANQNNLTWLYNNAKWNIYSSDNIKINANTILRLNLFGTLRYIDMSQNGDVWLINDDNHLFKLNPLTNSSTLSDFKVSIIEIQSENKELEIKDKISLNSRRNNLTARLSAPFYLLQNSVYYSYVIDGLDKQWSDWSTNSVLKLGYIPPGEYILKFKAKNTLGFETETQNLEINVPKPFTQTILFYAILLVAFATITYIIFKIRLQKLKKDKQILEQKVKERTATIQEQKSHIEKQHEEITGSIRYAKRIQTAMLPHDEIIEAMLPHSFILFNPRDIVSGDFYFFKPVGNAIAFVAADCTGHGVPGGFMSMLGMSFLGEITSQLPIPSASEIIDHLREKIKLTLGQDEIDSTQKDGMDLAICVIDIDNKQIQYSGAFNPLIMIRNGELDVVKADRQPVAVYIKETDFTNHIIDVQDGDCFYMFSDGFPDQIGGPKQRKFMSKNFKNLIHENHKLPMPEQKIVLQKSLNDWRGDSMQVDDILVIGFSL